MEELVEIKSVIKEIGNNFIIDDLTFNLEKGKIYGIIGENGNGKSLLLKAILDDSNLLRKTIISGYNLRTNFSEMISSVKDIADFVSFYDYLNAYENLRYFAITYNVHLSKVREILDLVGLNPKDRKPANIFSLEMKYRLSIAIALLKNPEILVIDELVSDLKYLEILEFRNLLLMLKDKVIIISSNNILELEQIVDEVFFIDDDKIMQKTITREDTRIPVKFRINNYENNTKILDTPILNEEKAVYNNSESLEDEILKMLDVD